MAILLKAESPITANFVMGKYGPARLKLRCIPNGLRNDKPDVRLVAKLPE
jgi:hypothetical protein